MKSILIIGNDAYLRDLLHEWLETVFPRCEVMALAYDDSVLAEAEGNPASVLLVDLDSLAGAAVDVIARLKGAAPESEIFALTMDNYEGLCQDVMEAGAAACVRKTDLADKLLPRLTQLVDAGLQPPRDDQRTRTVVCIEDEVMMIRLIELTLERGPFRVVSAESGEQGLAAARHVKPDVVLLDLMMPDMDGWEVARRMREDEKLRDIPIIAVTVVQPSSYPGRELPVDDYVTKPFVPQDLLRRVGEAVRVVA